MSRTAVVFLLSVTATWAQAEVPGIVKTKPAEGRYVETDRGFMVPYDVTIPGTEVTFRMEPIPGGTFVMGSPDYEADRDDLEGPQRTMEVEPFWMAQHEVTWGEYKQFMNLYNAFKTFESEGIRKVTAENELDAITAPTMLYEPEFTFEFGSDDRQPAVTVTQYSAKQYSKWMSAITETQMRLPTEAEWEYACRAGAKTAYHFGDDPAKLDEYAWYAGNTDGSGTKKVAQKKPNAWGLYDMHGNAAEWVLDYLAKYVHSETPLNASRDWASSEELDPRVVRGGSWEFEAKDCRCASRLGSDSEAWREYDPNLPKSPWWFTTDPARGVGFRLIRPLKEIPRKDMEVFWMIDNEDTKYDVGDRLSEGRGVRGLVDKDLPEAVKKLED
jgi:formylglycine-generating enzyme required for sulfatase activity